ncbi:MAG TPA: hypothetical protein ENK48_01810 [Gammaproteobacteria bacterium]|nr:hypothetical protein [Gammaproteobacteria bacterium]
MPSYRVIAHYDHPQVVRSAVVEAESAERAMVTALLQHHIPAGFRRDAHGWLVEEFWRPEMGGDLRWPRVDRRWRLVWGDPRHPRVLRFEVECVALSPEAGAD